MSQTDAQVKDSCGNTAWDCIQKNPDLVLTEAAAYRKLDDLR